MKDIRSIDQVGVDSMMNENEKHDALLVALDGSIELQNSEQMKLCG